jgi:hypothetical protein
MITHTESTYRPTLSHATSSEQWSSRSNSSTIPAPREPATSARGAPPSVFRHNSTGSSHTTTTTTATAHPPSSNPLPLDQPPLPTPTPTLSSTSSCVTTPEQLSPTRAKRAVEDTPPIRLRNLAHVVELAKDDYAQSQTPSRRNRSGYEDKQRYEISSMPVGDVIEMVAGLLTKITTTNDRQHDHLHRIPPDGTAGIGTTTNSVLAFHGKNVPSITIMSYLSRIHKYCPTTYEVFLSLLVYFDRMTERVNKNVREMNTPPSSSASGDPASSPATTATSEATDPFKDISHVFVVDSYNIHRLVIAGVTCASKFFSDVFYTNSRYAKVGGLPLPELNHLELQFLILNDFRLSVPVEELEAYGTMLVQFYAREAIANANLQQGGINNNHPPPPPLIQQEQNMDGRVAASTTAATA